MTKGKLYEECSPDEDGIDLIPKYIVDEAKEEFESILTLLKEPDLPNITREFQVLLCLGSWKVKWFGDKID